MKRRRLEPKPEAPKDGIFIVPSGEREEVFVPFDHLKDLCTRNLHSPLNPDPTWREDPLYFAKKQRKRL